MLWEDVDIYWDYGWDGIIIFRSKISIMVYFLHKLYKKKIT